MEQLELAIQYLKKRAVGKQHIPNGLMKEMITVLPLSEVEAVLEMVKKGEFIDFYEKTKRDDPAAKSPVKLRNADRIKARSFEVLTKQEYYHPKKVTIDEK